ncbi:MAG: alpha/beta fold hydrolase [Oscillospiraceae bacterium]|nr:alpha/beta fold hydrolase [Oscillospiraceae bacterium]
MKAKRWLVLALLMIFVGAGIAGFVQTSFGYVRLVDVTLETDTGTFTGYLMIPQNATAATPAPAIVTSHGYLNNREMQDLNYVELSRRGFVVFAMDAYSHGDSSVSVSDRGSEISRSTGGMTDAVEYLSTLDFVDPARIGVTGHSMGGGYADKTAKYYSQLAAEGKGENKVAAALIVGNVPSGLQEFSPYDCEVGIIAGRFDEFFIVTVKGTMITILDNPIAKGLLSLQSGTEVTETIVEGKRYENASTGHGIRMWAPWQTHPWNHFSKTACAHAIEFFTDALGAPRPISETDQIWQIKELCNCIALCGFFLLLVPLAECLMSLPFFSELKAKTEPKLLASVNKKTYTVTNLVSTILAGILIIPLVAVGFLFLVNPFWPQDTTGGIGLWTLFCGLISLLFLRIGGFHPIKEAKESGLAIDSRKLCKSILLALAVTCIAFSTVFVTDWLFKTDFRIWTFAIRAFNPAKIWVAVKYLPFFLVYYVINSLAVTRNRFKTWSEGKQIFMSCLWNTLGILLFVFLQYIPLAINGMTFFGAIMSGPLASAGALFPLLMFPVVPILWIAAAIALKMYKKTGNVWIAGLINAMVVTMLTVANTSFSYPY